MKKNIWIINHYAGEMYFQQSGRHYWLAKGLKEKGYSPVILCCNTEHSRRSRFFENIGLWEEKVIDGIPFVFIESIPYSGNGLDRIINMLLFYLNIKKVALQYSKDHNKPDIILASSVHPLSIVAGIQIAQYFKVECIGEVRDLWPESIIALSKYASKISNLMGILYCGEHWIYNKVNKLIFTMEGGKDYVTSKGWDKGKLRIDLSKVHYLNNGVQLNEYYLNEHKNIYHDEHLDNPELFKVQYQGSIRSANCISDLINVAKLISQKGEKGIKLLIWGEGNQEAEIRKQITSNELTNIVLKGAVDSRYIPNILNKGDINIILLRNSRLYRYGISLNKLFEYFASGKPIISNVRPGYSLIDKYHCGVCLDNPSVEAMANTIIRFSKMGFKERSIYANNSLKAARDFDYAVLTSKLINIIESECNI